MGIINPPRERDIYIYISGWWFGTIFIFPYIGNFIIPTDFHSIICQRSRYSTIYIYISHHITIYNHYYWYYNHYYYISATNQMRFLDSHDVWIPMAWDGGAQLVTTPTLRHVGYPSEAWAISLILVPSIFFLEYFFDSAVKTWYKTNDNGNFMGI